MDAVAVDDADAVAVAVPCDVAVACDSADDVACAVDPCEVSFKWILKCT